MKLKQKTKSILSTALAVIMLMGTIPITTTYAAQVNEYTDPADSWVSANGRTNELDVNATTTYETQYCLICQKDTTVLTYRVPEYTKSGTTAANRGVVHSDGANADGTEFLNLDDGTPGINAFYTSYHWTKSVCTVCGTINSGDGMYSYSQNRNVYTLNSCDHNFFLDFDNTTYEPYNATYHTTTLKKGQYCMFCKGTEARATEKRETHNFTEHIDAQIGNNRFYISEKCDDCGYETSEYITAKSVVSSYYGTADGEAHTLTVSDLSDSGVKTSIRYGTEADNCTKTSAPNYVQSGYYNIYYQITYSYGGESMTENGVSYVWLLDDNSSDNTNGTIIVVPTTHEHDYRYLETVPPTCENLGYERWQCDGCGELVKMNYKTANGHNYKGVTIKEPTCKQGGLILYLCADCGDFFEETTATSDHNFETHKHNPTCQTVGYTENVCTVCDYSYLSNITPLVTHSYERVTKDPTCTEKGYTTSVCTMCNLTNISDYTEPTGHKWNEGETVTSSTCEAEGVIQFTCENCNEKMIKASNANGHTKGTAATCTEPQTCEVCKTVLELPKGHTYTETIIDPTCDEMGYSLFECSDCHDTYTGNYTDKADHEYKTTITNPTCTEMGHTLYECLNCDYSFTSDYTDKEPHDFAEEITKPTCAEFGYSVFTCKNCPESYIGNYQDKLPHNYDKQIIPPTCTEHGYTVYKCPNCKNEYISDFVDCEKHSYTKTVIDPDCLNMGYTIYKCENCTDEYKADYVNAKGHTPSDWIIDVTPTIENGGTKHIECTVCGETLQTAELAQLIDKDNTDEDGNAKVGAFSIILTAKNNKPIFNSEISIDVNDLITIKLPSGRLLDFNDQTTITAFYTDTQKAAADLNIFIEDENGNHATGTTDVNGQLKVPNGESSTGNDNGTIGNEDNENKFTYVVRVTDRFNVTVPNCNIKIGESNNIVVKLPDGHILTEESPTIITVTDQNGNAQKGVSVIVIADKDYIEKGVTDMYGKMTVPPVNSGYTDKDGKVSLQTYYIFVNDEEKAIVNAFVKLNDDNTISVTLPDESVIAHSNRITVTVLTSDGESVKDMTVSVSDIAENSYTDITDENGRITVPPLSEDYTDSEGTAKVNGFNILVNDEIGNIENAFITISADNAITVMLPEANKIDIENRVSVTVTDGENNPVKSMSVTVTDTAEQTATDLTDDNGRITVPPTNIDYTDKDGNGQINGYLVNVQNETTPIEKAFISIDENNLISVTLPENVKFDYSNRVKVTVLNKADGTPAPSISVTVSETVIKADDEENTETTTEVRFIAVTNNVDSDSDNPNQNDFAPFLNIMNEWYAKDTSNKIKAVFLNRMSEGKRCSGSIPYGYNRLPHDKQTLVIDPIASKVVKEIFELAANGKNPAEIARILTAREILIPAAYTLQYHPEQCNHKTEMGNCKWHSNTVRYILNRQEYLGHTVLRKSIATNFKTGARRTATDDELLIFKNTHEPIISQELWDKAHKALIRRPRTHKNKENEKQSIFSGFLFCADCGSRMSSQRYYHKDGELCFSYRCSRYSTVKHPCTNHHIRESAVSQLVINSVKRISRKIIQDEKAFCEELKQKWQEQNESKPKLAQKELASAKQRLDELDVLITGLYENYVTSILPERQYKALMIKYSAEQSELETKIKELKKSVSESKETTIQTGKFIKIIKKYKEPTELTAEMLNDLIDKIVIHEKVGNRSCRQQQIDIYFNFIGNFDIAYTDEELAEEKRIAEQQANEKAKRKAERRKLTSILYRERKRAEILAENDGHIYAKTKCAYCGKEFYPNNARHIFCSTECKDKAKTERIAQKRYEEKGNHTFKQKKCVMCGKEFWPSNGKEILCSQECKSKNRREKQLAYYHTHKDKWK